MVQRLPTLPEGQGDKTTKGHPPANGDSGSAVFTPSSRLSRSSPAVSRRMQPHPHHRGQIISLAGSHSTLQHHHSDSGHCQRFRGWLGSQIWRSGAHHLRQGSAVLFRCVGTAHTTPRLSSPSHHSLPYHRQLKDALCARTTGGDWSSHLLWVLLGLGAAPKEASGISSAEVAYGTPLVLPSQLSGILESPPVVFKEDIPAASSFIPSRAPSTSPPDSTQIPQQLQEATFVYVCRGGSKRTAGHLW